MLGFAAASSTTCVSAGRLLCPRSGRVRRSSEAGLIDNVSMRLILPRLMAEEQPPGHASNDDQITWADDDLFSSQRQNDPIRKQPQRGGVDHNILRADQYR